MLEHDVSGGVIRVSLFGNYAARRHNSNRLIELMRLMRSIVQFVAWNDAEPSASPHTSALR
jgi:hypothetical protein